MIIDTLIPDDFKQDYNALYKARVLIAIIIIYSLIITGITLWLFFFADTPKIGKLIGTATLLSMQIGYVCSMLILRFKSWFNTAAHITIFSTAAGIASGILVSGGPINAPAISMNILPIIMAFVLINKRAGLIWTQVILTLHVSLMIALAYGVEFMQVLKPETLPMQHLAHWLITYTAMIGLMFVIDALNSYLKKEANAEKIKLEHLASQDPLTKLANRLQFDINLTKTINRSNRHKKLAALFYIDLDDFESINEEFEHDTGDIVLQTISRRLETNSRDMDTVARLGGDEFGIIFEDIVDEATLKPMADKLLHVLSEPIQIKGINKPVTIKSSIGIAIYPNHSIDKEELITQAETAMRKAKRGKNQWAMYSQATKQTVIERQ